MWFLNKLADRKDLELVQKEWSRVYYAYSHNFDIAEKSVLDRINEFNLQLSVFNRKFSGIYGKLAERIYLDLKKFSTWDLEFGEYKHDFLPEYEHIEKIPSPYFEKKIKFNKEENHKKASLLKQRLEETKKDYDENIGFVKRQCKYIGVMEKIIGLCDDLFGRVGEKYDKYIAPELEAITALLYAEGMKRKIERYDNSGSVTPARITDFKGGKYDAQYEFVHNVYLMYSEINGLLSNFNLADYAKNEHILEVKTSVLNQRAFTINELSKKLKNDIQMSR